MRRVEIGAVTLFVLDDGTLPFPAHFFFRDVPRAQWEPYLEIDAGGKIPVGHNCALLQTPDALIVLDTGYGADTHGGRTGRMLEDFARTGWRREDVSDVVFSHAHGDHIKGSTYAEDGDRRPAFARARHHIARADWEWFGGNERAPEFTEHLVTLDELGLLARTDGALELTPEVRLLPTPGHTPGHTSVLISSADRTAIYLGDLCHLPVHVAHPEWVSTFDTHPQRTPRTRADLFALALERDALLICPHAPSPGLGRLARAGDGVRWEPETKPDAG